MNQATNRSSQKMRFPVSSRLVSSACPAFSVSKDSSDEHHFIQDLRQKTPNPEVVMHRV